MEIIRSKKDKNYTVLDNTVLFDKSLSLAAKGLHSYIMALPEEWQISVAGLETSCRNGRDAINSCIKELEQAGYLQRSLKKGAYGKFDGYEYILTEKPFTETPFTEKPFTDFPFTEKPQQINTNKLSTNSNNVVVVVGESGFFEKENVEAVHVMPPPTPAPPPPAPRYDTPTFRAVGYFDEFYRNLVDFESAFKNYTGAPQSDNSERARVVLTQVPNNALERLYGFCANSTQRKTEKRWLDFAAEQLYTHRFKYLNERTNAPATNNKRTNKPTTACERLDSLKRISEENNERWG